MVLVKHPHGVNLGPGIRSYQLIASVRLYLWEAERRVLLCVKLMPCLALSFLVHMLYFDSIRNFADKEHLRMIAELRLEATYLFTSKPLHFCLSTVSGVALAALASLLRCFGTKTQ